MQEAVKRLLDKTAMFIRYNIVVINIIMSANPSLKDNKQNQLYSKPLHNSNIQQTPYLTFKLLSSNSTSPPKFDYNHILNLFKQYPDWKLFGFVINKKRRS